MSSIVTVFDPQTTTSDSFSAPQSAANGSLHFWNESNIGLSIKFSDGTTMYVPGWFHRHKCGATGSVNITWTQQNQLVSNTPPLSEVIVEAYDSGESFPADGPLNRQTNIGNAIGLATSATSIANDGNVAGTPIVEATVAGDVSSAVTWTNDGQLINGNAIHPGSVSLDNAKISSDGAGNLTANGLTAGNFLVADNTCTVLNGLFFPNGAIRQIVAGNIGSSGAHLINLPWNDIVYRVCITPNNAASGVYFVSAKNATNVTINVPVGGNCDFLIFRGT